MLLPLMLRYTRRPNMLELRKPWGPAVRCGLPPSRTSLDNQ